MSASSARLFLVSVHVFGYLYSCVCEAVKWADTDMIVTGPTACSLRNPGYTYFRRNLSINTKTEVSQSEYKDCHTSVLVFPYTTSNCKHG